MNAGWDKNIGLVQKNNGRVNLAGELKDPSMFSKNPASPGIAGFSHEVSSEPQFQQDMLRGNWEHNALSEGFFSQANLTSIQTAIRRTVFERSQPKGYVIDDQSVDELKMIMRGLYYQYARNNPTDIQGQIQELNQRVLDWSVPHILSAVDHYMYYLKDIDSLPIPMSHPVNISGAGTRSKQLGSFM